MPFNILSKDSLRRMIENSSDGKCTVLYDDRGFPSYMSIIPKMKIGDVWPSGCGIDSTTLLQTHPAFIVDNGDTTQEIGEIFVGQYLGEILNMRCDTSQSKGVFNNYNDYARTCSLPGRFPTEWHWYITDTMGENYYENIYDARRFVESKGTGWHIMNVWERSLLYHWAYNNNLELLGNSGSGVDRLGNTMEIMYQKITIADSTGYGMVSGDIIHVTSTGAHGKFDRDVINTDGTYDIYLREVYGEKFVEGDTIVWDSTSIGPIDSVVSLNPAGSGSMRWAHDRSTFGVFDLVSPYLEVVDGIKLVYITSTLKGIIKMAECNYLDVDETNWRYQQGKLYDRGSWMSPPTDYVGLGYQSLDGTGQPEVSGNNDTVITWGHQYLPSPYSSWTVSSNFTSLADDATKIRMYLSGMYPKQFTESTNVPFDGYMSRDAGNSTDGVQILVCGSSPNSYRWVDRITPLSKYVFRPCYMSSVTF